MTPVLLLDLDGVLNPFAAPACPDGYQERVFFEGEGPVRCRAGHGAWIRELAAAGELWWATGRDAAGLGRPRGRLGRADVDRVLSWAAAVRA